MTNYFDLLKKQAVFSTGCAMKMRTGFHHKAAIFILSAIVGSQTLFTQGTYWNGTQERLQATGLGQSTFGYGEKSITSLNGGGWTGSGSGTVSIGNDNQGIDFHDNTASKQAIAQNVTNVNLEGGGSGNGALLTVTLSVNNASTSGQGNMGISKLVIHYNNVAYFTVVLDKNTGSTVVADLGTGTLSFGNKTIPVTTASYNRQFVTLGIKLPATISNSGSLDVSFSTSNGGAPTGDFMVQSVSLKAFPINYNVNVFSDGNGLTDNMVNNSTAATIPSGLYANLVNNGTGQIVASTSVAGIASLASTGTVSSTFYGDYSLVITTANTSTAPALPAGWVFTGQSKTVSGANTGSGGTGSLAVSVMDNDNNTDQNLYFGIDSVPVANPVSLGTLDGKLLPLSDISGYAGIASDNPNAAPLSGRDHEDGTLGTGSSFEITSIDANTLLYYNGVQLSAGSVITYYDPALLKMYGKQASMLISFMYASLDAALEASVPQPYNIYFSCTAMPVSYAQTLSAKQQGANVLLNWATATEINNKGFKIQRSIDGSNFTDIGFVGTQATDGNSTKTLSYTYSDADPVQGTNYYRLMQTDLDGTATPSTQVSIRLSGSKPGLSVYPNPAHTFITIGGLQAGGNVVICNTAGRVVKRFAATSASQQISIGDLASGVYFIKAPDGGKTTGTFIVK